MTRTLAALLLLLMPALAPAAEVYRWVDKDGVVHYTDKPPSKDAKPAQLPPIQTVTGGLGARKGPPPATAAVPEPGGAPPPLVLTIVAPRPDETFRSAERSVTVSVALQSPLPAGAGLLYLLDGSAQNPAPTRDLSFVMTGVERGSHLLAVAAVDAAGRELARSPPVIVHMKPPKAN